MASSGLSPDRAAAELGRLLSGTEAQGVADRLADGDTLSVALGAVAINRRDQARSLLEAARLRAGEPATVAVLRAVAGALSSTSTVDPLWTMPGHLVEAGRLTSSVTRLVEGARVSVTCSTYNFQRSSGLWEALRDAARNRALDVRVYVDAVAADADRPAWSPSTEEVAAHLRPAVVLRTTEFDGRRVRNHAKFLAIDHRFVLVTSANFSWSAEYGNVELGVLVDDRQLVEAVERQLAEVVGVLYEVVEATA